MGNMKVKEWVHLGAVHMMLARFEGVGVRGLCDDSIAHPPVPGSGGVAAAAAGTAVVATRYEVLGTRKGAKGIGVLKKSRIGA
jgi:hypothetical protein